MTDATDTTAGDFTPGEGSLLQRLCNEARWGLAATRASILEAAHPQIGAALVDHSTFVAHPWRRLRNTVVSTQRIVGGDERVRDKETARLNRLHSRISGTDSRGRPYDAMDPEARAWVVATLFESTVMMCRLGGEPLDQAAQERLYAEFRALLGHLGDAGGGRLPATLAEFWPYYEKTITEGLENTEAVHAVLYRLFAEVPAPPLLRDHPATWAAVRALAGPLATAITVASLPESYRRQAYLTALPGARVLMHGAYLTAGLATRWLPSSWTRTEVLLDVLNLGPGPGQGSPVVDSLRDHAGKVGALLRLVTPVPTRPGTGGSARRSAERFFAEVLDQTGDGYLDWPDLAAMAREIASRLDLDEQAENRLFTAYAAWWEELRTAMDADGDGRIDGQEYATATTLAGRALIEIAEILFDATDTDGDQAISPEEYRVLFRTTFDHDSAAGAPVPLSRSAFVREFLAFMAGRHHSAAYENLLTQT
ncbi:oxygenase MpaB family protein [Actinocorallia populi]|uniref:oxygenase MpaB family protein n=1 Tax=Actinocorallia populi TaxID=2079200 RepID=UPI000D089563|nr:oxygenase MpaB family protein [Actinocorallia populi]